MTQYRGAIKWALYMIALLAVGPLAAAPLAALRDATGGHHATILVNTTPASAVGAGVLLLAAAGAMGLLASRLIGPRQGLITAGLVVAWGAWQTASLDSLMRASREGSVVVPLAIEGGVLGAMGIGLGALLWALGGDPRRGVVAPPESAAPARPGARKSLTQRVLQLLAGGVGGAAAGAIAVGVVAGGLVVWLVAQEPLKGQCIAAAWLAGIAAGGFGRAVAAKAGPPSPVAGLASLALLAVIGPISLLAMNGGGASVVEASIQGRAFPLGMPMPLDWLAGALWGIPIGLSWADSMVDKQDAK